MLDCVEIGSLITRQASLRGGRPIVAGTGICVQTIVNETNRGLSPAEIAADRPPLSLTQIHAALAFYHANRQEVDEDIRAEEQAYDEVTHSMSSINRNTSCRLLLTPLWGGSFQLHVESENGGFHSCEKFAG